MVRTVHGNERSQQWAVAFVPLIQPKAGQERHRLESPG